MAVDDGGRALGERLLRALPVAGFDLGGRVAGDLRRGHAHLQPQDVLAVRRAAGVGSRGLAGHDHRLGRQRPAIACAQARLAAAPNVVCKHVFM